MRALTRTFGTLTLAMLAAAAPQRASACGGTFCDTGPVAMPVDQTGENIVFVMGDGIVEAHVQIQYTGDPEKFAWVVPMPRVPEEVVPGSQAFFTNILGATVPTYSVTSQFDQCEMRSFSEGDSADANLSGAAPTANEGGPRVVFRKSVGSFEVAALEGGTADEVMTWLEDNGYDQSPLAPPILADYVERGFVFVAVKLQAGAGLDEIHPLTFIYEGGEACVPLELTSIAAVEDMGVRTFFFSRQRVVPTNYRHVLVNPIKIDWLNSGSNYNQVITEAVDSDHADGKAFVTEYAGPSSVVPGGLVNSLWDASRFVDATPENVMAELSIQGFGSCNGGSCFFVNPLIQSLLGEFLIRPVGVSEEEFYECVSCYSDQTDQSNWDGAAFAEALEERVVAPARRAEEILGEYPYLTRMFTTISPDEMTLDPLFMEHGDLDDVALPTPATLRTRCDGTRLLELPDGQVVALGDPQAVPVGVVMTQSGYPVLQEMPAAVRVEEFRDLGDAALLADNSGEIEKSLRAHNARLGYGDDSCGCRVPGKRGSTGPAPFALGAALGLISTVIRRRRRSAV